jgi:hypothetical protein
MSRAKFLDEITRPVFKHVSNGQAICDSEGQIEIRPTVSFTERKRTNRSPSDNTRVGCSQLEDMVTNVITIANAEHMDTYLF